jgi:3'-5' exoribonuclease
LIKESGEKLAANLRDNLDLFVHTFKIGDTVTCNIKERKNVEGTPVFEVIQIKKATVVNKSVLVNYDQLLSKFDCYIKNIQDKDYKRIVDSFFDGDIRKDFLISPAAKSNHHAYKHGLLEHTVEVVEISVGLSKYLKDINNDLLIAGALLHDVGKMKAYDLDLESGVIERTDLDDLIGHLSMSALFVSKTIPDDIDPQKSILLYHIILSHHGKKEWGSPIEYKFKEAFLVHQADMISSRCNHFNSLKIEKNNWTEEDKLEHKKWLIHE